MAKERRSTKGAILSIDVANGSTYLAITLCRSITPPGDKKSRVDATALEDDDATSLPGIAEESEWSAELIWDPEDAVDASLKAAQAADSLCAFKVQYVGAVKTHSRTWSGYITEVVPVAADGSSPALLQIAGVKAGANSDAVA